MKIAVAYPAFPTYRLPVLLGMKEHFGDVRFIGGKTWPNSGLNLISSEELEGLSLELFNIPLSTRLFFSKGLLRALYRNKDCDVFILHTSFSWVSFVLVSLVLNLFKKQVVHWIHGPINNVGITDKIKYAIMIGDFWTYGDRESKVLREIFPKRKAVPIFNSLCRANEFNVVDFSEMRNEFVFIGRIRKKKRLDLLLRAFVEIVKTLPKAKLRIIGDGEDKSDLMNLSRRLNIIEAIVWEDFIYTKSVLRARMANCIAIVSPGEIGLLALDAFSMGLPVITHHNRMNQMPEFDSCINGVNSILINENSIEELVAVMIELYSGSIKFDAKKIVSILSEKWSVEGQLLQMQSYFDIVNEDNL